NKESLKELMGQCDAVIHTAGMIELGYKFIQEVYDINVTGTKNVLETAKESGVKKVVHFSSVHAFSHKPYDVPIDESRPFVTERSVFYDQTKRDGHVLAFEAAKEGLDVVIVCPTSAVGPPDHKPSKLGKAVIDIYKGSVPAVVKGGFDFADVRDMAKGAVSALTNGRAGETYILGGRYYTIKEFSDLVLEAKGTKKRLTELPLFVANIGLPFVKSYAYLTNKQPLYDKAYIDILQDGNKLTLSTKAQEELGYSVRELGETLTDTVEWFRTIGRL
ncbi:MAG: NAD-dependent epimerase/dehydratase family protein, partial [Flavobacteriia bacterium]|nr:NAD-dependent epimerase/dehydratase family protein [Flavobacteriia bacterium]